MRTNIIGTTHMTHQSKHEHASTDARGVSEKQRLGTHIYFITTLVVLAWNVHFLKHFSLQTQTLKFVPKVFFIIKLNFSFKVRYFPGCSFEASDGYDEGYLFRSDFARGSIC